MKFAVVVLSGLLVLTGCSSEKELEYDPVELIEYEACLSQVLKDEYNQIEKWIPYCSELRPSKR
jgi:hypothetical protein